MAIAEACGEDIHLRSLLCEFTGNLCTVLLYNDSQSAQKLVENYVRNKKSKHIHIGIFFIKHAFSKHIINWNI